MRPIDSPPKSSSFTEPDQTRPPGRMMRVTRLRVIAGPDVGRSITSEREELSIGSVKGTDLTLSDPLVSRYHVTIRRSVDGIEVRDMRSTNGTMIGAVRLREGAVHVVSGAELVVGRSTIVVEDGEHRLQEGKNVAPLDGVVGASAATRAIIEQVHDIAGSLASVVLLGESGTGKEVFARAIHATSPRASGPFEVVDCGALSTSLFASELFGYERGAFTGADRRHVGAFERASGGTLLLDELGELPMDQQVALLGAIERRKIRRLGGSAEIPIDVRVLAATHRDLRAAVNAGKFRLDLYYRLAVVLLAIPSLRERREDIRPLVEHFLDREDADPSVRALVTGELLARLEDHDWPGNVRELRNVVSALVATRKLPPIGSADASVGAKEVGWTPDPKLGYGDAKAEVVARFERRFLEDILARSGGNFREAARLADMDRSHLLALLRKHGFR
ncbi:hypothetical protein BH09MYX1_BH09MYX1_43110 [soil metagenome]